MSEPFDLDAALGGESEPFRFKWGGQDFELPRLLDLDLDQQLTIADAIAAIRNTAEVGTEQLLATLRLIVGESMMARLSAAKPLSARGVLALLGAWKAFQEEDLGKSAESEASSESTAPQ